MMYKIIYENLVNHRNEHRNKDTTPDKTRTTGDETSGVGDRK
jgi:hypothetical protein